MPPTFFSDDDAEQLAALNDERDRIEIRDELNRELLEHEAQRLHVRTNHQEKA
jgi:hypothetical protein